MVLVFGFDFDSGIALGSILNCKIRTPARTSLPQVGKSINTVLCSNKTFLDFQSFFNVV